MEQQDGLPPAKRLVLDRLGVASIALPNLVHYLCAKERRLVNPPIWL